MIFFSPSLYVTVSVWPSTPAAWLATVALVIVLLGKSQFEKPSAGCTLGGKMRIAIAFWLPSGCGEAVMARYEPSFMSESGAFTTSLTGALSASLIFISPPSRAFAVKVPPSTLVMVARTRTDAGVGVAEQMTKFLLRCMSLLLAQSGHRTTEFQCPLLGVKRT